nr:hypothetical protein [Thetidibacter halocola]
MGNLALCDLFIRSGADPGALKPNPRKPTACAAASNATGSWFDIAMSKAAPSMCLERFAPPTARLCSGLR